MIMTTKSDEYLPADTLERSLSSILLQPVSSIVTAKESVSC